jgi:magnesium-protoporphyrin IX monomethyl ester (oxidative) cyclase
MPFAAVEHPSLALSLLQATLAHARIPSTIHHANLDFAADAGLDLYRLPDLAPFVFLLGDWVFARAAFPGFHPRDTAYLRRVSARILGQARDLAEPDAGRRLRRLLLTMRSKTADFTDRIARRILETRPRLVGCSSSFQQHTASLALLRRIRELAPDVVTVLGGPNCEAEMGLAVARACPWVDIVFSGDADLAFPDLCRLALRHGHDLPTRDLPAGAITRDRALALLPGAPAPRAVVLDPAAIPLPNFDDYFTALEHTPFRDHIRPGLLFQTSRGCWWGAKRKCAFCGLHPADTPYRSLPAGRIVRDLTRLSRRYRLHRFEFTDNILDPVFFASLLPRLGRLARPYRFFAEAKANLSRRQVRLLARAGFNWIQAGLEGLHDDLLRHMGKGVTTLSNLQLLKYARELGVRVVWNLLAGLPGEQDAWHAETAAWLPLIHHLEPPAAVVPIMYKRFSAYTREAERLGLQLRPSPVYTLLYPFAPTDIRDLAYYYLPVSEPEPDAPSIARRPGVHALVEALRAWRRAQIAPIPPVLAMTDHGDRIAFFDTRACAPERRPVLRGHAAALYRACEPAASRDRLAQRLAPLRLSARRLDRLLAELLERKLLLKRHGRFLGLAVPGEWPLPPPLAQFPGGHAPWPDLRALLESVRRPQKP